MKKKNIVKYTLDNLPKDSQTDWKRLNTMSEEEIQSAALSDPDAQPTDREFWKDAKIVISQTSGEKKAISFTIDKEVLYWFKAQGKEYQSLMNAVLKAYMDVQKAHSPKRLPE
jgi:uncharacterized protein (DUF4415 family)